MGGGIKGKKNKFRCLVKRGEKRLVNSGKPFGK